MFFLIFTLNFALDILHPHIFHFTMFILHFTTYNWHLTICTLHFTLYTIHYTIWTIYYTPMYSFYPCFCSQAKLPPAPPVLSSWGLLVHKDSSPVSTWRRKQYISTFQLNYKPSYIINSPTWQHKQYLQQIYNNIPLQLTISMFSLIPYNIFTKTYDYPS